MRRSFIKRKIFYKNKCWRVDFREMNGRSLRKGFEVTGDWNYTPHTFIPFFFQVSEKFDYSVLILPWKVFSRVVRTGKEEKKKEKNVPLGFLFFSPSSACWKRIGVKMVRRGFDVVHLLLKTFFSCFACWPLPLQL